MGQLVLFVWGFYRMYAFLTTKYGLKTIFGFSRVSILNVHTGCHYKNLLLFQIVNKKYAAWSQTGTVIELDQ